MPVVKCVLCREEFVASRSTKMYCGCDERRRPLGGYETPEEKVARIERPIVPKSVLEDYVHSKIARKIREMLAKDKTERKWYIHEGKFDIRISYE